jgi:hypothetical protein
VVDSRGWFAGRRYVVPVGQIDAEEGATALRTTLTRAELARYPEFSPSAFTAMDDNDALRYERRLHRMFAPDTKPYDGRPVYENLPVYRTPTWLMTGVWMSDSVSVPPVAPPEPETGAYERTAARDSGAQPTSTTSEHPDHVEGQALNPERERMIARGISSEAAHSDRRDAEEENPAKPREPRIERYRER